MSWFFSCCVHEEGLGTAQVITEECGKRNQGAALDVDPVLFGGGGLDLRDDGFGSPRKFDGLVVAGSGDSVDTEDVSTAAQSNIYYTVTVEKTGNSTFGLEFDLTDETMAIVAAIGHGHIERWNKTCDKLDMVEVGDVLVKVNDVQGNADDLVLALKGSGHFELTFQQSAALDF
eukprot:TRINITY_DN70421_c0_g1_i1.p1 TRINITY_DN70421_c0_g1~~TRINITY_DN70421_c0_g1_i1.p1  ORF type:complete len:194 (+),score=41.63 TRINITY_DN70421_c0_g1_i1:63-584(+)